jgi:hypothetical protein
MVETTDAKIEAVLASSLRIYKSGQERAALRCGLADGTTICDLIATEIEDAGRPSKRRREMVAVAKRCADAIYAMRGKVRVPDTPDPAAGADSGAR